jgi:hypothetical protein
MIPVALFSDFTELEEKEAIAAKLHSIPQGEEEIIIGKPTFPDLQPSTRLRDLVTHESFLIFDLAETGSDWLGLPLSQ